MNESLNDTNRSDCGPCCFFTEPDCNSRHLGCGAPARVLSAGGVLAVGWSRGVFPQAVWLPVIGMAAGLAVVHVTGVFDDFVNIRAGRKLALQVVAGAIMVGTGSVIRIISLPVLGLTVDLGVLAWPVTLLWIVGMSNAVNLIDGIDGFSGGVTTFAATAFGALAVVHGHAVAGVLAFALAGAAAGFLRFNLPKARIFMGDGGSLFVGAALAVLPIVQSAGTGHAFEPLVVLVVLAIPIFDTAMAIARRVLRRVALHTPDREHFHHLLVMRTGSVAGALRIGYPIAAALAAGAVAFGALMHGATARPAAAAFGLLVGPVLLVTTYLRVEQRRWWRRRREPRPSLSRGSESSLDE